MALYNENSVCPECGGTLALKLFKKGLRINCIKCQFKVYPQIGEISESLAQAYCARVAEQARDMKFQLADIYPSVDAYLKKLRASRGGK